MDKGGRWIIAMIFVLFFVARCTPFGHVPDDVTAKEAAEQKY